MHSDPKQLIEMVAGGVSAGQLVEGKLASRGFYITLTTDIRPAMKLLTKQGIEHEWIAKTPIPGVQGLAFASKADRDKADQLLRKAKLR